MHLTSCPVNQNLDMHPCGLQELHVEFDLV